MIFKNFFVTFVTYELFNFSVAFVIMKLLKDVNMNYRLDNGLTLIREFFNLSQEELANILEIERITILRTEQNKSYPKIELMDKIYNFCFEKGLRLNIQK